VIVAPGPASQEPFAALPLAVFRFLIHGGFKSGR
jgi:hypothetical protein